MASAIGENLTIFTDRLTWEIENIRTKLAEQQASVVDSKSIVEAVNMELEMLIFGIKYEMEAFKNSNDEILNVSDELSKARSLIKLQTLTAAISEHIDKILV